MGLKVETADGGMDQANFDAGISLLLSGDMDLRGERSRFREDDNGPGNQGGECAMLNPNHRCPPGLGSAGLSLSEVQFDRPRIMVGAGSAVI